VSQYEPVFVKYLSTEINSLLMLMACLKI